MKVIGNFKYNNTSFVILNDDNTFRVGKIINKKVTFDFNEQEKLLIKEVVSNLAPKGEIVKGTPITINNNRYDVYHDYETNLFFFNPVPNEFDLSKLNHIFNNMSEYVYIPDKKTIIKDAFKRIVTLGSSVIIVTLASTVLLSIGSNIKVDVEKTIDTPKIEDVFNRTDKLIQVLDDVLSFDLEELDDPLGLIDSKLTQTDSIGEEKPDAQMSIDEESPSYQDLIDAINANPNLSDYEKRVITSKDQVFKDNFAYMNPDVISRSKTVTVKENVKMSFEGQYNVLKNEFEYPGNAKATPENIISHEFGHLLQCLPSYHNSFITEGLNSLFNEEYYAKEYGYPYQKNVMKCLAEILGVDNIRKMNYQQNSQEFLALLYDINPDANMNMNFLTNLREYNRIDIYGDDKEKDNNLYNLEQEITAYIKLLYRLRFAHEADDDLLMLYYLDSEQFRGRILELYNFYDPSISTLTPKIYFNSELKCDELTLLVVDCSDEYSSVSLLEALDEGIIKEVNGEYIATDGFFIENDRVYYPPPVVESQITINDNNRYLGNTMNR